MPEVQGEEAGLQLRLMPQVVEPALAALPTPPKAGDRKQSPVGTTEAHGFGGGGFHGGGFHRGFGGFRGGFGRDGRFFGRGFYGFGFAPYYGYGGYYGLGCYGYGYAPYGCYGGYGY